MRTHLAANRIGVRRTDTWTSAPPQKVVIVNGSPDMLALVESALGVGRYNLVFIESNENAYSEIKRMQPHLVILCTAIEHLDGFQVLSMLKLDNETRGIPVVTFTTENDTDLLDDGATVIKN